MKTFPRIYLFEVEVDSTYPAVHELFMHQTVLIRYTFSETDGKPNKVKFQPDPMLKGEANLVEGSLKRIGAKYKVIPR